MWRNISLRNRMVAAAGVVILFFLTANALVILQAWRNEVLQETDAKLLAAAYNLRHLLPPGYHDRITGPDSVSVAEFEQLVARNDQLCTKNGLQYVWSVLALASNHLVFTSATSPGLRDTQHQHARFFERHSDPAAFADALRRLSPSFSSFDNKWGRGRMVLLPERDRQGRVYLLGASMATARLGSLINETMLSSLALLLAIALPALGLVFLLARSLTAPLARLTEAAAKMAEGDRSVALAPGGGRELAQLTAAFETMRTAVAEREEALRQSEQRVRHLNEVLGALHAISHLLRTEHDEARLLQATCETLVHTRGYVVVWIGRVEPGTQVVRPVARAGREGVEAPAHAPVTWDEGPQGQGPAGTAIRERRPVIFDDIAHDPRFAPWREPVVAAGVVAIASVPMLVDGQVLGALTVKADQLHAFSAEEVALLDALAQDLARALQSLATEVARRRAEALLQQAQKLDSIGRLAGGVAHDINNVLQTVLGFTEVLLDSAAETHPQRADLLEIRKATERGAAMTRQLLAFSRKQPIQPCRLDLNYAVREADRLLRRLLGEDIRLELALAPQLWPTEVDPGQLNQVIVNLAINARDAMPQGGSLTLSTANVHFQADDLQLQPEAQPGPHVCLSISDTGMGMSPAVQARLFEPFFTTKNASEGTGLGLAVIYGIVKQHHGWLHVYSREGQGSTFKVFLPADPEHALDAGVGATAPKPAAPEQPPGRGERLLLVEDEEGVRTVVARKLQSLGYAVTACHSAEAALALGKDALARFDLLLSDVVLPGLNGLDLAHRLRARRPALPVLLCSGYTDERTRWGDITAQGLAYLQKPYTFADLLQTLRRLLDERPA